MFNKVLIPLNLMEKRDEVYSLISFMNHFDTETIVLYTVASKSPRVRKNIIKKLTAYKDSCSDMNFTITIEIGNGPPAVEIIKASLECDFIAFPWERKSIVQHALLGSVTKDVVRLTEKPVLIYKQWFLSRTNELDTVLFASDLKPLEQWVIPYITYSGLAADNLVVVHVGDRAPDPEAEAARLAIIDTKMDSVVDECKKMYQRIEKVITPGKPHRVVVQQARKTGADLVIISKHSDGSAKQKVLGTTAENIVHRAGCSVLVVPNDEIGGNYER